MLSELLQDRAALYVSGAMTDPEREKFDLVLEFHQELRAHVAELQDTMTAVVLAASRVTESPDAALRSRILQSAAAQPLSRQPTALVVTNPAGLVEWVNPAFTAMCGYSVEELKGRKPGHLLQGAQTDAASVGRIREALRTRRPCRETLVNYHKDGTAYFVDVRITPILDDQSEPLWFIAQESKVDEVLLAS